MKYLLSLLFLVVTIPAFAQKQFLITTSNGWKVNYNKLKTDKPLPKHSLQHSRFSGFSFSLGLEYKPNPNWGIHTQIKSAGIEMGLNSQASVRYDTASNKYKTNYGGSGGSGTSYAPAHYQLGLTYYSDPVKESKFSWLLGGGVAYLVFVYKYPQDFEGTNSGIGINDAPNNANNKFYGKSFNINLSEEFTRNGILLNVHTGFDFHFASKHHLLLTLQHNEGLRRIIQYRSDYFNYVDFTPAKTSSEAFEAVMFSKGSYTALQLGYKYSLFTSK